MKNYLRVLFLSTVFLTSNDCFAVNVNGQEYTDEFTFYADRSSNISFKLSNNDIQIGVLDIDDEQLQQVANQSNTLVNSLGKIGGKLVKREGGLSGQYLTGSEKISFDSKPGFRIEKCILESPSIEHKGDRQQFSGYYAKTTNPVVIKPYEDTASSIIKELTYFPTLPTTLPYALYIQGDIDFAANETNGMFIVVGAEKVKVRL